ncbi:MAG: hypothetical protein ACE5D8_07180 [Fidelibacterota bacterium]
MTHKATCRWLFICLVSLVGFIHPQITGNKRIAAIRVDFPADDSPGTTGNGQFLLTAAGQQLCEGYTLDAPPHDRDYFRSHLTALDHYFRNVSHDRLTIDLLNSTVFPLEQNGAYTVPHAMNYYHSYGADDTQNELLITELFRDAVQAAFDRDSIDFSLYDIVIVFHAGIGQDFALPFLDPTPEDIPSTYVDNMMIQTHLGLPAIPVGDANIAEGIILPETQNHLLYNEMVDLFGSEFSSCDYQFALTGTASLLTGFLLGFPPLWNTDTGESGIGIFGLMDQGSNNGRGVIPAPPDAWTRLYADWESPQIIPLHSRFDAIKRPAGEIGKIELGPDEYYLIENRSNEIYDGVSIDSLRYAIWERTNTYPPYIQVLLDSVPVTRDSNGVIITVPNYDIGLPNSGLLIWHIDDKVVQAGIASNHINSDPEHRGIDLVEADGAKDIGFQSVFPFNDPSAGYFADMWYQGNLEYVRFNPDYANTKISFGPYTIPDTRTFSGAASYIAIDSIGWYADTMSIVVNSVFLASGFPRSDLYFRLSADLNGDGQLEFIGGKDSLWIASGAMDNRNLFYPTENPTIVVLVGQDGAPAIGVVEERIDSTIISVYSYDGSLALQVWTITIPSQVELTIQGTRTAQAVEFVFADRIVRYDGMTEDVIPVVRDVSRLYRGRIMTGAGEVDSLELYLDENDMAYLNGQALSEVGRVKQAGILDLNLDGQLDALLLDNYDNFYALDSHGLKLSGFPVRLSNGSRWLSRQLVGDERPEIVIQDSVGNVQIYDWQGNLVYSIANPTTGQLIQMGRYAGQNAFFTRDAVWVFDNAADTGHENAWAMVTGSPIGDRISFVSTETISDYSDNLLDKSRTYVYPNPVTEGKTTFRITTTDADYIECEIFDIAGYFTTSRRIDIPNGQSPVEWTWITTHIEPGVYLARVKAVRGSRSAAKTIKIGIIK